MASFPILKYPLEENVRENQAEERRCLEEVCIGVYGKQIINEKGEVYCKNKIKVLWMTLQLDFPSSSADIGIIGITRLSVDCYSLKVPYSL